MYYKQISLLRRAPHLTHEEFIDYWQNEHIPRLTLKIPHIRAYTINDFVENLAGSGEPEFDGMTEMWFDSSDLRNAAVTSEAALRNNADNVNFQDLTSRLAFRVIENRIIG